MNHVSLSRLLSLLLHHCCFFLYRSQSFLTIPKCSCSCWAPEQEDLESTWRQQTQLSSLTVIGWVAVRLCIDKSDNEPRFSKIVWLFDESVFCSSVRTLRPTCRPRTGVTASARPNRSWCIAWSRLTPSTRKYWRRPPTRESWSKWSSTRVSRLTFIRGKMPIGVISVSDSCCAAVLRHLLYFAHFLARQVQRWEVGAEPVQKWHRSQRANGVAEDQTLRVVRNAPILSPLWISESVCPESNAVITVPTVKWKSRRGRWSATRTWRLCWIALTFWVRRCSVFNVAQSCWHSFNPFNYEAWSNSYGNKCRSEKFKFTVLLRIMTRTRVFPLWLKCRRYWVTASFRNLFSIKVDRNNVHRFLAHLSPPEMVNKLN